MSSEQKVFWFKQWNQPPVLKEVQKFPKVGVLNAIFEKWLHKVTFWYQVHVIEPLLIEHFFQFNCFVMSISMDFNVQWWSFLFKLQLEIEARKFLDIIVTNLKVFVLKSITVQSLEDFISHWRLELQESVFFVNSNKKVQYSRARPKTKKLVVKRHSKVLSIGNNLNVCFYSP
jgi:hypothetical protein